MTGLDPVIHVFVRHIGKTWMAGSSPAMTTMKVCAAETMSYIWLMNLTWR
jgi:hypothetical protein